MRREFPRVFGEFSGTVFERTKSGRISRIRVHHLLARCLTAVGTPGAPLVYCPASPGLDGDGFYRYDPGLGIYQPLTEAKVRGLIDELLARCAEGSEAPDEVHRLRKVPRLRNVAKSLKGEGETPLETFLPSLRTRHVANGILDLETLELRDFTPEAHSLSRLPVTWDRHAAFPRRFVGWLRQMFPAPEGRDLALSVMAMSLLGNPLQKLVLLRGPGNDGKTTFVKLMAALVGKRAAGQLRLDNLNGQFEAQRWFGKLLLHADEVSGILDGMTTDGLKRLSGQSPFEAELKNRNDTVQFESRALPVLVSNADVRIELKDDEKAWQRRLIVLETSARERTSEVKDFEKVLLEKEGPGILRLVAVRAQQILQRIDAHQRIRLLTPGQRARISKVLESPKTALRAFVDEHVERSPGDSIYKGRLKERARPWLRNLGVTPPTDRKLSHLLNALMEAKGVSESKSLPDHPDYSSRGWRQVRLVV